MNFAENFRETAKIYEFPVKTRIAANRFAEQVRLSRELSARRAAAGVMAVTGWYHDEAIADDKAS